MSVYNINYSTTFNIYRVVTDNSILSVSKNKKNYCGQRMIINY